jgi:hypothetical protein
MIGLKAEPSCAISACGGDIIKTMDRVFTERGQDRGIADYVMTRPLQETASSSIDKTSIFHLLS